MLSKNRIEAFSDGVIAIIITIMVITIVIFVMFVKLILHDLPVAYRNPLYRGDSILAACPPKSVSGTWARAIVVGSPLARLAKRGASAPWRTFRAGSAVPLRSSSL